MTTRQEIAAWNSHRRAHRLQHSPRTLARERSIKHANAWNTAIAILDQTELKLRDLIERELAPVAGLSHEKFGDAMKAAKKVMRKIEGLRTSAFKKAFRHIRALVGPSKIAGYSLATLAASLARDDRARIDNAVRSGLINGLNSTAIARQVVGSAGMRGIDGVTEVTRQRIARLGRAAVKPRILRKKGNKL